MLSDILNRHPRVLSLFEFFSFIGMGPFHRRRPTGDRMWGFYARQRSHTRLMLRGSYEELLYPFDDPPARFTRRDVPPILCATLPHLTSRHDALFDELEPIVRNQPRQPPADHIRRLFARLCERFGCEVWVERSGASLMFAPRLLRAFPEARVIHIHRDGRETALSMSGHYLFRMIVATMRVLRCWGIDVVGSMAKGTRGDRLNAWLDPVVSAVLNPDRLPYDKVTLADFAAYWNGMIERSEWLLGHLPPDRLLQIRFEDMQAEPEAQIRRLARFIGPTFEDEAWLREAVTIPQPTPLKFERLPADERAAITRACRPGLERLGYPP